MDYEAIGKVYALLRDYRDAKKMRDNGLISLGHVFEAKRILEDITVYYRASTIFDRVARFYENYGFEVIEHNKYYKIFFREGD